MPTVDNGGCLCVSLNCATRVCEMSSHAGPCSYTIV